MVDRSTRPPWRGLLLTCALLAGCGRETGAQQTGGEQNPRSSAAGERAAAPPTRPSFDPKLVAPEPPEDHRVVAVAMGSGTACAVLHDGSVWCWGNDAWGTLGWDMPITDNVPSRPLPTKVQGVTGAVAVAVGRAQACAWSAEGKAICWGAKPEGEDVYGPYERVLARPLEVPEVDAISLSEHFGGCARRRDGTVSCWRGVAGIADPPRQVAGLRGVDEVRVDGGGVGRDGSYACLGVAGKARCGKLAAERISSGQPFADLQEVELDTAVRSLSLSGLRACAVLADETVSCWWLATPRNKPGATPLLAERMAVTEVAEVVVGIAGEICLRKRDGSVWCRKDGGEARKIAVEKVTDMATDAASCVLDEAGVVHCWGPNYFGQLSDGTRRPREEPKPISW